MGYRDSKLHVLTAEVTHTCVSKYSGQIGQVRSLHQPKLSKKNSKLTGGSSLHIKSSLIDQVTIDKVVIISASEKEMKTDLARPTC